MLAVGFLILFPLVPALLVALIKNQRARGIITYVCAAVIMIATILLACQYLVADAQTFQFESELVNWLLFAVDLFIAGVIIYHGVKRDNGLAILLAIISIVIMVYLEFFVVNNASLDVAVEYGLYVDTLSVIMALIIGIVGSAICIYAVGYMQDFSEHHQGDPVTGEYADRRGYFFALMFVFLSAMYMIVFANNLSWLYTGWEVTTVCSFLLIGYTRTDEAIRNSFRQINMNLLGGIAFGIALIVLGTQYGTLALDEMIEIGQYCVIPVGLIAFAGLTKAAQMPFQSWLLGAMVAPTPTSALLHSSTMVKAGVFILLKLAPCMSGMPSGMMVIAIGSITFIFCSAMAISETNGKRVLAYSTISNLGLICICAGIGTAEAVWAGIFLIIFHACAKALLFMCVGTAEHHIGSRNIEDMDNLFVRMPKLARCMAIGMLCMFIAPFGMLISKWGVMVSLVDAGYLPVLIVIAFGSALTFIFWAKWLGKICAVANETESVEDTVHGNEWFALGTCIVLVLACCLLLPAISSQVVVPYLSGIYGSMDATIDTDNLLIMAICVAAIIILYIGFFGTTKGEKSDIYLGGGGIDPDARIYQGATLAPAEATSRNMYLTKWFGAETINLPGSIAAIAVLCIGLLATVFMGGVLL